MAKKARPILLVWETVPDELAKIFLLDDLTPRQHTALLKLHCRYIGASGVTESQTKQLSGILRKISGDGQRFTDEGVPLPGNGKWFDKHIKEGEPLRIRGPFHVVQTGIVI